MDAIGAEVGQKMRVNRLHGYLFILIIATGNKIKNLLFPVCL